MFCPEDPRGSKVRAGIIHSSGSALGKPQRRTGPRLALHAAQTGAGPKQQLSHVLQMSECEELVLSLSRQGSARGVLLFPFRGCAQLTYTKSGKSWYLVEYLVE